MTRIGPGMRSVVSVGLLAGVLAGGWGRTADVRAAVGSRGDPLFSISGTSGGAVVSYGIQLGVTVSAASTQVQRVTYALHGPVGTAVKWSFNTDDSLSAKEAYTYTADRTDLQVVAVTTVTTTGGSVPVTVNEAAVQVGTSLAFTAPFQVSGMSNQSITTSIGGSQMNPSAAWGL